jgi:hypothetical protein
MSNKPEAIEKVLTDAETAARKKAKAVRKQNKVTVNNTYTEVPFYYKDGTIDTVYIKRSTAIKYRLPEVPQGKYAADSAGKVTGKNFRTSKGKSIAVSDGYLLKDRKTATKGKKTGAGGKRSIALTKSYSRRYQSLRVPLTATTAEVILWIKTHWGKKPDTLRIGAQQITLGLNKSKAQHKAETAAKDKAI